MASALLAIRCLCHWWIKVATLFGSFDRIPRRWIGGMVVPFLDPNSFVALKSRSTPSVVTVCEPLVWWVSNGVDASEKRRGTEDGVYAGVASLVRVEVFLFWVEPSPWIN